LIDVVDKADCIVDKPATVHCRNGAGKRKLDADDIYSLYECLDKANAELPTFVAVKLKRVPTVSPSEVDVCALAANADALRTEVAAMADVIKKDIGGSAAGGGGR
jgi:hypothetical protein